MVKIKYKWDDPMDFGVNKKQIEGELSTYIEGCMESHHYGQGRLEQLGDEVESIKRHFAEFVEMLVEEKIITIEQVEKFF